MRGIFGRAALCLLAAGCARNLAPPREIDLAYEGPIESRDIVEGGRIYTTLCTACHRGRVNPRGYSWSPGQMRHQIREGNRLMPPLSDELLSDSQVEAVLAYLSVMGALDGELPPRGGPLDLDEERADEAFEDDEVADEPELVGATESPELAGQLEEPAAADSQETAEAETDSGASGADADAAESEPAEPGRGEASEGAAGLAPPSGAPTDRAPREDGTDGAAPSTEPPAEG